jgi:hypothetical protein
MYGDRTRFCEQGGGPSGSVRAVYFLDGFSTYQLHTMQFYNEVTSRVKVKMSHYVTQRQGGEEL